MTTFRWLVAISVGWLFISPPAVLAMPNNDIIVLLANTPGLQLSSPDSPSRQALSAFLKKLPRENRIAMLSFNESTSLILPLTQLIPDDSETLLEPFNRLQPGGIYSNSAAAVERAIEEFATNSQRDASKTIVIIADAQINTGDPAQDRQFSNWMRELLSPETAAAGIRAYSIAYSKTNDVQDIEILAQATGGRYERVDNASEFRASLESIAESIATRYSTDKTSSTALNTETTPKSEKSVLNEFNPVGATSPERSQNSARHFPENVQGEADLQPHAPSYIFDLSSVITRIKALIPEVPSADKLTAWIATNTMLLVALLATILIIGFGFLVSLRYRKRSTNLPRRRGSKANTIPPAQLEDLNGISNQRVYDVSGKLTWIRRAPAESSDNVQNVVISDHLISRDHAFIEYADGGYWISDRSSANGTFVNDQRITTKKLLKYGDRIRFAKHEFKFAQPPQLAMSETVALTPLSANTQASLNDSTYPTGIPSLSAREDSSWDQPTIGPGKEMRAPRAESFDTPRTPDPQYETVPPNPTYNRDQTLIRTGKDGPTDIEAGLYKQDDQDSTTGSTSQRGGTDKLPEYHHGDTIMFQRDSQHTGTERANHIEPTQQRDNTGNTLATGEEQQADYQRGGTRLYRQPDKEISDLMSTFRNESESDSPSHSTCENAQDWPPSSPDPQIEHSDTVAISREQMQRILGEKHQTTPPSEVPVTPTAGRTRSSLDKTSPPPDQAETAYPPTGESPKPGLRKHPDQEEDLSETSIKALDSKRTDPSPTAPDQHKDTVLIPQQEMQRMMELFSHHSDKPRSPSTPTDGKSGGFGNKFAEPTEIDRRNVPQHRDEIIERGSPDHAPPDTISNEGPPVSGEPTDPEPTHSAAKQPAPSYRGETLAIPTEEIEKMVRSTEWDGSESAAHPDQTSLLDKSSSLTEDDTEEFWLDSTYENNEEKASSESPGNGSINRPMNVGDTDTLPPRSPIKTPSDQQHTPEPALRTQPIQDDIDRTQIIPPMDRTTYLDLNAPPQATDDDDAGKTEKRPRHED